MSNSKIEIAIGWTLFGCIAIGFWVSMAGLL
jgi:hypothetical protein